MWGCFLRLSSFCTAVVQPKIRKDMSAETNGQLRVHTLTRPPSYPRNRLSPEWQCRMVHLPCQLYHDSRTGRIAWDRLVLGLVSMERQLSLTPDLNPVSPKLTVTLSLIQRANDFDAQMELYWKWTQTRNTHGKPHPGQSMTPHF